MIIQSTAVEKSLHLFGGGGGIAVLSLIRYFVSPEIRPHLTEHTFQGANPGYHSYATYRMLQFWFQQIYARQYYMQ